MPRVCFNFSEPLARRTDFSPYVAVSGSSDTAISNEDQQICVEGLKHGERYAIVLRQGLPSAVGESLLKSADYEIYVRDRSPQAHFAGRAYVLPREGQKGAPLVTVNTDKVSIDVYRIGDRNLLATVNRDDFLKPIDSSRAQEIASQDGAKVWSGTMDVASALNQDVVTDFPVLDAVGKLEPGVYVITARPWKGSANPADASADESVQLAAQWMVVSDLGLTAISGDDGVHALVQSLGSAAPIPGVELRLIARNNEVLAAKTTGADGRVDFDPGLSRGKGGSAPGLLVATLAGDYGFLSLAQNAFDLTDRGVAGRDPPAALDAFLYTERGVYRSGETVFATALLRDSKGVAKSGLALTLVVKRPDGVEYRRATLPDQGLGGRAYAIPLLPGSAAGKWSIEAYADPKGSSIGRVEFLLEDYIPERLDFTLHPAKPVIDPGEPVAFSLDARFLYGAPASGLDVTGAIRLQAVEGGALAGFPGYVAGLADDDFTTVETQFSDKVETDDKGHADLSVELPEGASTRPLEAKLIVDVGEPGGRTVERTLTLPVRAKGIMVGVKKDFDASLSAGDVATFEAIAVQPDGRRIARKGAAWSLYQVTNDYQWFNADGRWSYEPVKSSKRLASGTIDIGADMAAKFSARVGWGAHRLDIKTLDGQETSVTFDVGWSGTASADTPDNVVVTLDKTNYAAGEEAKLRIASAFAGKATIALVGDRIERFIDVDLVQGDNVVPFSIGGDWGPGAYAVALTHRPLDIGAKRMPGPRDRRRLVRHRSRLAHARHQARRAAARAAAPIDDGSRSHRGTCAGRSGAGDRLGGRPRHPQPDRIQDARRERLFLRPAQAAGRDSRSLGHADRWHAGGGRRHPYRRRRGRRARRQSADAGAARAVLRNRQGGRSGERVCLVRSAGVQRLGAADRRSPGRRTRWGPLRLTSRCAMLVVVAATLPRFLNVGDRSEMHVDLDNVEGEAGDYKLDLDIHGPLTADANAMTKTVRLDAHQRQSVAMPITAAGVGVAGLDLRLTGPKTDLTQHFKLGIASGAPESYRRTVTPLPPGGSQTLSGDLVADFIPGTGSIAISASPFGALDAPALLAALQRYPYGCSEQTVSIAMPLLYVNRLASIEHLGVDPDLDARINQAIERELSRQSASGAFGMWSADSNDDDLWLDAFVTDFLTRARERNFAVPGQAFDQALDRLRNEVVNAPEPTKDNSAALAYALYVLARNGRPVIGDLRYLTDAKLDAFTTPLGKAQLAAALAMLGDQARAASAFGAALKALDAERDENVSRPDYGSRLRDAGGRACACRRGQSRRRDSGRRDRARRRRARAGESVALVSQHAGNELDDARGRGACRAREPRPIQGRRRTGQGRALPPLERARRFPGGRSSSPMRERIAAQLVVSVSGAPIEPDPAAANGYAIERSFYKLDGTRIDALQSMAQNERVVVALKVTEAQARRARLLVVDRLPAGLEIDNPALVDGGSVEAFSLAEQGCRACAYRIPRRPFRGGVRSRGGPVGVHHHGLCGARRRARPLHLSAGDRRRHVRSRTLRPHRFWGAHGEGEVRRKTLALTPGPSPRGRGGIPSPPGEGGRA